MKRKIEEKLASWKATSNGRTALLIDGARRAGKSYIVEEFAKKNYKSYIMIDFNKAGEEVRALFEGSLDDLVSLSSFIFSMSGNSMGFWMINRRNRRRRRTRSRWDPAGSWLL